MSARVLPGNTKGSAGDQICLHSTQKEISCLMSSSIIHTRAPSLHFSVALLLFLLCFSASTLCFSSSAPPRFLLALRRPEQHRARARLPGSPAARPGLARRGAGHGGVVRRGGEGAGLQGAQRAAVQHGPGPAERSQASHRTAHRQGWSRAEHEYLPSNYTETMRLINPFCGRADAAGAAEVHPAHQPVPRLHQ